MYINKNFTFIEIMTFAGHHIIWLSIWATSITLIYKLTDWDWVGVPWLPLSLIGIAVAFYVGFKNNQSYDRMWEARKIWGGIVNASRAWGTSIKSYVSDAFMDESMEDENLNKIKKRLIYRHIAWLYSLREQLLKPTNWEHISLGMKIGKVTEKRMEKWGVGMFDKDLTEKTLKECLSMEEYNSLIKMQNTSTQIIDAQGQDLAQLRIKKNIDDFRHIALQDLLKEFYALQGKCERIKKFPFPRQYASLSNVFIGIFIFLLPFGLITEFSKLGEMAIWLNIPFTVLVGWVFMLMELVGDYSENPFEGLGNDIPMLSLCRTIEIDLKEMLGETELPPPIEAKRGVLL